MTATSQPPLRPLPPLPSRTWWRRFTAPSHVSPDAIKTLRSMGYDRAAARRVLSRTGNNLAAAIQILESEQQQLETERDCSEVRSRRSGRSSGEREGDWSGSCDSSTTYSSAASWSTGSETQTPGHEKAEYLEGMGVPSRSTAAAAPAPAPAPSSTTSTGKRRWFSAIGPIVLQPTRTRTMRVASSAACPGGADECRSPNSPTGVTPVPPDSPTDTSVNTTTNTTTTISNTSTNASLQPPQASTSASTRRRWPLHLSKERLPKQPPYPQPPTHSHAPQTHSQGSDGDSGWVHVPSPRDGQSGRGQVGEKTRSATQRHSVHGGPIIAVSTLRHARLADEFQGPGYGHDGRQNSRTVAPQQQRQPKHRYKNNHPYAHGRDASLPPVSGIRQRAKIAQGMAQGTDMLHPTALKQHPFASSITKLNEETAEESSDAESDSGTFGIKSPTEWHWSAEHGDSDCPDDDDDDDFYDDDDEAETGVDVQAWRANMSTLW